jgi:hypothetical protein
MAVSQIKWLVVMLVLFSCYLLLLVEEGGRTSCGIGVDLMAFSTQQQ